MVWQAAYLPFGKAQVVTEMVSNNLRFPGQYFDAETGMHYNWHRFYDPETGRYISADPIGLDGGMNVYSYVSADPVNAIDPHGLVDSPIIKNDLEGISQPDRPDVEIGGPFILTDKGAYASNTIKCGMRGLPSPHVKRSDPCYDDCIRQHEYMHVAQVMKVAPGACSGKNVAGMYVKIDQANWDDIERSPTQIEVKCLQDKLNSLDEGCPCYEKVRERLDQVRRERSHLLK